MLPSLTSLISLSLFLIVGSSSNTSVNLLADANEIVIITDNIVTIINENNIWIEYVISAVNCPVVNSVPFVFTIICAPIHDTNIINVYITICINGWLNASIFWPFENNSYISFETFLNLFISYSSFTKDLTTLIPDVFSSTTLFKSSYFLNVLSNIGITILDIPNNNAPNIGTKIKYMYDICKLIFITIISADISINGALTIILIVIWNAFWTL